MIYFPWIWNTSINYQYAQLYPVEFTVQFYYQMFIIDDVKNIACSITIALILILFGEIRTE